MKHHTLHPDAAEEYAEAAAYYAGIDLEPGCRFYDESERSKVHARYLSRIDSTGGSRRRVVGAEIQALTRARRFRSAVTFR